MSAAEQTHDVYQLLVFREPTVDSEIDQRRVCGFKLPNEKLTA